MRKGFSPSDYLISYSKRIAWICESIRNLDNKSKLENIIKYYQ